jgi:5-deoxy-glucuronate isomerase
MDTPYLIRSDWAARIWIEGVGEAERRLEVTPAIAGWRYLSFRSYTFRAGQVIDGESASDEMAMVLLSGAATIEIGGPGGAQTWACHGRSNLFDGAPFAIYLPPGHTYRTTVHADADCAYGRAPAQGLRSPRLIRPEETIDVTDAGGNRGRRILGPEVTEHLLCQETVIESTMWAFVPPHRHGADDPPRERYLEEAIYYRADPGNGWGLQRLDAPDAGIDVPLTVRHGDAVIVRGGHHPVVAAPGSRLYALSYLAGPDPAWPE